MNTKDNHTGWSVFLWVSTLTLLSLVSIRALFDTQRVKVAIDSKSSVTDSRGGAFGTQVEKSQATVRRGDRAGLKMTFPEPAEVSASQLDRNRERPTGIRLSTLWSVSEKAGLWGQDRHLWNRFPAEIDRPTEPAWLSQGPWESKRAIANSLVNASKQRVSALGNQVNSGWSIIESRWEQQARIQVQMPETGVTPPAPLPQDSIALKSPAQELRQFESLAEAQKVLPWFLGRLDHQRSIASRSPLKVIPASRSNRSLKSPAEIESELRWPVAQKLINAIEAVQHAPSTSLISKDLRVSLAELRQNPINSDASTDALLAIDQLLLELNEVISENDGSDLGVNQRQLRYELQKRLEIWRAVQSAAIARDNEQDSIPVANGVPAIAVSKASAGAAVLNAVDRLSVALDNYSNSDAWKSYLGLDEISDAFASHFSNGIESEIAIAYLSRFDRAPLGRQQASLLSQPLFQQLHSALLQWNDEQANFGELLSLLEKYESRPLKLYEKRIQEQLRQLQWSENPAEQALLEAIERHYRNANIRFSLGESLVNSWIPANQSFAEPVTDQILGAQVSGFSQTQNSLQIDFLPDSEFARIAVYVRGNVTSNTRASRDGFIFHNRGYGQFVARKEVLLTGDDVSFGGGSISTANQNSVVGLESSYDGFPIIGAIARSLAMQNQSQKAPLAKRIVERKMGSLAQSRFEEELRTRYASASEKLMDSVIVPLDEFAIRTDAIQAQTSDNRMTLRYRIAGDDQLSAFSARPRALATSDASIQIHQSTLNNLVRRLQLDNREGDLPSLYEHIGNAIGRELMVPEDIDPTVQLQFAPSDSIEFNFVEDRIEVTIRLSELRIGNSSRWTNVAVSATLMPIIDGMNIQLIRDPESHIGLPGRQLGFRDQVAIRTIFNKVFDQTNVIPIIPEQIQNDTRLQNVSISQFEIRDGWIGMSIENIEGR